MKPRLYRAIYQYQHENGRVAGHTFWAADAESATRWANSMLPKGVLCLTVLPISGPMYQSAAKVAAQLQRDLL